MWIFCCGSRRSGSTLQYNMVSELLETNKTGKRIEFVPPNDFIIIKNKYASDNTKKVFKSHMLTHTIEKEFDYNNAIGIYSYRDIRDVIVSASLKNNTKANNFIESNYIEKYIKNYFKWRTVPKIYRAKYENFVYNVEKELQILAFMLDIKIDNEDIKKITNKLSIENLKEHQKKLNDQAIINNSNFDTETLLHVNHINSGKIGQWEKKMTKTQILRIEQKSKDWLFNHNYQIQNKNLYKTVKLYSYSQHGEDDFIWKYFNKKRNGLIVDVGAFDGIHLSNSYALENIGWQSINIEPNDEMFKLLCLNRPYSNNYNVAVVEKNNIENVTFNKEKLGLLSGLEMDEKDVAKRYKNRGIDYEEPEKINVKAKTLNSILKEINVKKGEIDCISIDVEGTELSVLKSLDIEFYRPQMLIIEANNEKAKNIITSYMRKKSYKNIIKLGPNLIFVPLKSKSTKNIVFDAIPLPQIHPLGKKYTIYPNYPLAKNKINFFKRGINKLISVFK